MENICSEPVEMSSIEETNKMVCSEHTQGDTVTHADPTSNGNMKLSSTDTESDDDDTNYAMGYTLLSQDSQLEDENEPVINNCSSEPSDFEARLEEHVIGSHHEMLSTVKQINPSIDQIGCSATEFASSTQLEESEYKH